MSRFLIILILLLGELLLPTCIAQIVITQQDLADAGDTILVSIPGNISGFDYTLTGADYWWDFSTLQQISQRTEAFISVFRTGITYNVFFADVPFNPNRANMAQETTLPLPALISASDSYNFYFKHNQAFEQVGIGTRLNGVETAIRFDENDIIYRFPLQYGDIDTSDSEYDFTINGLAYYHLKQRRINEVDGWGTLITPLDTFEVLRVKTTLIARDSLFIDSLNIGIALPRPREIQYKWLAKEKKIPLLQINTRSGFGNSFVVSAFYQDVFRSNDTTSVPNSFSTLNCFNLYPIPASSYIIVEHACADTVNIFLFDMKGSLLMPRYYLLDQHKTLVELTTCNSPLASGHYLLMAETPHYRFYHHIIKF